MRLHPFQRRAHRGEMAFLARTQQHADGAGHGKSAQTGQSSPHGFINAHNFHPLIERELDDGGFAGVEGVA